MKPEFPKKKSAREATSRGFESERDAAMDPHQGKPANPLLNWDELTPQELSKLTGDADSAAQLEHLQAAEQWLQNAGPKPTTPCPPAEDLYDLGQGPGASSLANSRASELALHLEQCTPCRELVETLASTPPVPLDLEPELAPVLSMRRPSRTRFVMPLAAAAAVLAIFGFWQASNAPQGAEVLASLPNGFPQSPLLRGGAGELAFPRGVVLERTTLDLPAWATELTFEVRTASEADSYRIEIRRHESNAFDAGATIGELTGESSTLEADAELLAALTPGHYTWEAWSLQNDLERRIGARDFEVREAGDVWSTLAEALAENDTLDARAVRYLHELGLLTDAQRLALALPSSAERDAYLAAGLR